MCISYTAPFVARYAVDMVPAGAEERVTVARMEAREVALAMNSPEVRDHDRLIHYAPTNLNRAPSVAWLGDMRKRWANVIQKASITLD
jgi:hypothetical protein